jgi:hypothetical protein
MPAWSRLTDRPEPDPRGDLRARRRNPAAKEVTTHDTRCLPPENGGVTHTCGARRARRSALPDRALAVRGRQDRRGSSSGAGDFPEPGYRYGG